MPAMPVFSAKEAMLTFVLIALTALSGPLVADQRRTEAELSLRHEALDSGFDDWSTQRLDVQSTRPGEPSWYGALIRAERYGLSDESLMLGTAVPLDENWVLQPEMERTIAADFSSEWYADLRLQRRLPRGFVVGTSLRHTRYDASHVDRLALGVERYWGMYRAAYTLNISDVSNAGTPVGHALALERYYGERSRIGIRAGNGKEEEGLPGGKVVSSNVTAVALHGRHWVSPEWALSWDLGSINQGSLYTRHGIQLGIRRAF